MRGLIQTLLALIVCSGIACAGTIYLMDDSTNTLLMMDPVTHVISTVGSTGVGSGNFGDLAYNSATGTLFWAAGSGNNSLYTLNTTTGAATLVGSHGINVFDRHVDSGSYSHRLQRRVSRRPHLQFRRESIDGRRGSVEPWGRFINNDGVAYDADTNVYWADDYNGNVFSYNATTFARTTIHSGLTTLDGIAYVGASGPSPVPEPSSTALVAAGCGLLVWLRRRK